MNDDEAQVFLGIVKGTAADDITAMLRDAVVRAGWHSVSDTLVGALDEMRSLDSHPDKWEELRRRMTASREAVGLLLAAVERKEG